MDADKLNEAPVPNRILVDNLCTAARRNLDNTTREFENL